MTSTGTLYLGVDSQASSWTLNGYISDARIVKGTALYSGATYTVPTASLTTSPTYPAMAIGVANSGASSYTLSGDVTLSLIHI